MALSEYAATTAARPDRKELLKQSLANWNARLTALQEENLTLAEMRSAQAAARKEAIARDVGVAQAEITKLEGLLK